MKVARALATVAVGLGIAAHTLAQGYPSRPVRIIVPFFQHGLADIVGRAVGQNLSGMWGQPVVVENRAGAGGTVGTGVAAKSPADGYTILINSSVFAINPALYANLPYDPERDFVGIAPLVNSPEVLVVPPSARVSTIAELIAAAKSRPGQLKFGSRFARTISHLYGERFRLNSGIDVAHVPGKGVSGAVADLVAGRVTYGFLMLPVALQLLGEGKLIALGVGSVRRWTELPEVPTMAEAGMPGFEFTGWHGMWAPAGTPPDVVDKLASDVALALATPDLRAKFSKGRLEPISMDRAEFARFVSNEVEEWARIVKAAGLSQETLAVATPTVQQRPLWQQHMDQARSGAAAGKVFSLRGPAGVFTVYNNPRPFCYMYFIPGDWVEEREPGLFWSKDGKAVAGVLFRLARAFEGFMGGNLVERAANFASREHEAATGKPLKGEELAPFESARPGTWKWTAAPVREGDILSGVAPKIFVDLSPEAIVQITISGTPDDDGLARRIIESLKTTSNPKCYWAELERELMYMHALR